MSRDGAPGGRSRSCLQSHRQQPGERLSCRGCCVALFERQLCPFVLQPALAERHAGPLVDSQGAYGRRGAAQHCSDRQPAPECHPAEQEGLHAGCAQLGPAGAEPEAALLGLLRRLLTGHLPVVASDAVSYHTVQAAACQRGGRWPRAQSPLPAWCSPRAAGSSLPPASGLASAPGY